MTLARGVSGKRFALSFPGGSVVENPPASEGDRVRPLDQEYQLTLVVLPGKSHGQRNLVGYSSWDCKELDTTEATEQQQQQKVTIATHFFLL